MFGIQFYNQTTRRYVAIFGTLFNDISITRSNAQGAVTQTMKVPLSYGPMQKFLAKIEQDRELNSPAITLPRMSFELTNIVYDGDRKLTIPIRSSQGITSKDRLRTQQTPAPYNLEFALTIMVKNQEDGLKIVEQILPYFKPDFTVTAKMIDNMDMAVDIPIVLNSVSQQDTYEGSFEQRRALIWTLTFTLKGYYYGPVTERKIIKFVDVNMHSTMDQNSPAFESIQVQPGLTANGQPTTNISQTVPYSQIDIDDNWAYIVRIVSDE